MARLSELQPGESGRVLSVEGGNTFAQRLMVMGVLPEATVAVIGVAPMGDPITVELHGRRLSLRRGDAAAVTIEKL